MKLSEIAAALECRLEGDGDLEITGVAPMENAGPAELTFLANPKYAHKVKLTRAGAILVSEPVTDHPIASLVSANPYLDFARALELFHTPARPPQGVHPLAYIAPSATLGDGASVGPFCSIGPGVVIGRNAVLHAHVVIYPGARIGEDFLAHSHAVVREHCRIGDRVTLQNGVVIGGDGFGFAKRSDGTHYKIVQSGITVIEDDVEIQSLSNVDRATVGETRIRRGAKLDSLVQVGHACVVGEDSILCGQVGLAGSTVVQRNVVMAGQAGSAGHITIEEDAVVYAQAGLAQDVPKGGRVAGYPAIDSKEWLRAVTAFPKLPEIQKTVRELNKRITRLEEQLTRSADAP